MSQVHQAIAAQCRAVLACDCVGHGTKAWARELLAKVDRSAFASIFGA